MAITDTQQTAQFAASAAVSAAEAKQYALSIEKPIIDIAESVDEAKNAAIASGMYLDETKDIATGLSARIDFEISEKEAEFESQMQSQRSEFELAQQTKEDAFLTSQVQMDSDFNLSQTEKEDRFQQFLISSGYVFLGGYEDGPFQFSARNQYIRYNNQYYRLNAATDVGFITSGTTAASFANDVTHFVLMDGDTLRQNLGSSEEGMGAWLVAYLAGDSAVARTVAARLRDFVSLHDYWYPTDGTDYAPALNKALSVSPHVLIPPGKHYLKSTVSLISGTRLIGLGPNCILSSPDAVSASGAEMLTVLRTTGASDIVLRDLVIEGGCNAGVTSKRAIRGVRFINCTDIRMINCEVSRTGDWATSFEKCTDVSVVNYRHRKSGGTLYGGRDGIHFLDCVNFTLNGADIESGDDMVGCTTETRDQRNAVIRNVIGYSMLASGVIFNEEGATTFSTVDILVDGVTIKSGNVVRDVVRVQGINDATNVTGVTIQNVKGTGYSHGVFISGKKLTRVSVSDVDVVSTQSHGVYINGAQNMRASGMGVSQAAAFDGWNITNCSYFDASPRSLSSQGWGVQVLNCANFTLNGNCYNNGAGLFAAANGGNGRINGCSNYNATGVYAGGSATSYYGLFNDETPTGRVDPATVCNGYIPRNRPRNLNALRDAYAACSFGQTVSGSISLQGVVNCSVELVSDGRYRINFTTPFESTFYRPEIVAQAMNQDLIVRPIAKDGSYYMFEVRNSSGVALANFILCEFKKAI